MQKHTGSTDCLFNFHFEAKLGEMGGHDFNFDSKGQHKHHKSGGQKN